MKKTIIIIFSLALIIGLTGCGEKKQITCTKSEFNEENNTTLKMDMTGYLDNDDKIDDVTGLVTLDISELSEYADQLCDTFKQKVKQEFPNGVISCSKTEITIDNALKEEARNVAIGSTKDEFIKEAEELGFTCK